MSSYETSMVHRETVADRTMAFHFARPPGFTHQAGQSIQLTLFDSVETDSFGPSRTVSIASAPHEANLMIAMRIRDTAFKRTLSAAEPGLKVRIDGPNGMMVLHEDASRPAVFLAGGIGITPFLSIVKDAAYRRLPHRIFLFYSNRRPEDAPFLEECRTVERTNSNFRLIATMTQAAKSSRAWSGETGFFRREMLARHLPDLLSPIYYFAGPPSLAMTVQAMLASFDVSESDMRSEEFYGY